MYAKEKTKDTHSGSLSAPFAFGQQALHPHLQMKVKSSNFVFQSSLSKTDQVMTYPKQRLLYGGLAIGLLLLVPFFAMQFTDEVNWSGADFIVAGVLLVGLVAVAELISVVITKKSHRLLLGGVALIIFLLVWAELAVGIFGSPFSGT